MAASRLHKLKSVFERVNGLLESKVMAEDNKPLWYDIYKRYPPKLDPSFSQPVEMVPINPIFYPEDKLRAELHKLVPNIILDLNATSSESFTDKCQELMNEGLPVDKAINMAPHVIFSYQKKSKVQETDINT